jgi:hypothetical protein
MDFYEEASLVMVPSGYKDQKVYSSVPDDGSGDLTFSRASSASRVGPDGLIEKVRTNVCLYSEQADNAFWGQERLTITANATTNPIDGATTADKMVADSSSNTTHNLYSTAISVTSGITYVVSAYFKKSEYDYAVLGSSTTAEKAWFNLTTGVKGTAGGSVVAYDMVSVGDGWYRCWAAIVTTSGSFVAEATIANVDGSRVISGVPSGGIFCFGFQLESGDVMTDYIVTTTAAVSVGPVANLPRLDYLDSSSPRLLLEPQRTNLITFSDGFTNGWTASGGTITATANYGISPDGYQNSTRIQFASANLIWRKSVVGLTGNVGTFSLYIKGTAGQTLNITYGGVDLLITLGSGWNRYSVTATGTINEVFLNTFSGSTAQDIEVYGGQAELGSYATSYIPTLGASVTRLADAASKTGISSLIGQTEGVLFYDFVWNGATTSTADYPIVLSGSDFNNFIGLNTTFNSNQLLAYSGGSAVASISGADFVIGQRYKIALAYKANDFVYYVNGTLQGSDTSGAVPIGLANLEMVTPFGAKSTVQNANSILFFQTRLSNADLATLTTL